MKKLLVILLSLPLFSQAQDSPNSKWSIGANFSTDVNYRTLNVRNESFYKSMASYRRDVELPLLSYSTGVLAQYHFSSQNTITTGIQYSLKGYQTENIDSRQGRDDPSIPKTIQFKCKYYYIDIPVHFRHYFGSKKVQFVAGFGVNINLLLDSKQEASYNYDNFSEVETINVSRFMKRYNLSPMLSAGINYKVNNQLNVLLEPVFRHQILINGGTWLMDEYLNTTGINLSVFHRL